MKNNKKKEDQIVPIVSSRLSGGGLVELVLEAGVTKFCVYEDGTYRMESSIQIDGEIQFPLLGNNSLLKHRAVLLPTKPELYGSEDELLAEILDYLHMYVDLSPSMMDVACAYIVLTWVYDAFPEIPYLRFIGDFGSGKSRALWVIGSICNKPFFASAASTISPVFYTLDLFRGTLVLDEADFRYSDLQSDITKILNQGSMRGFPVLRQSQNRAGQFDPRAFNVFGPKLLAMRKNVDDIALESRFLTEEMGGRPLRHDIPLNLPDCQSDESQALRNKLLMYRFKMLSSTCIDTSVIDRTRSGRFNQMIAPLLSSVHDKDMRSVIRTFAENNDNKMRNMRSLSIEAELLEVLLILIANDLGTGYLTLGEITSLLKERFAGDFERPITNRFVGQLLRGDLGLSTFRRSGVYVLPASEFGKIGQLAKRYGLT